MLARQSNPRSSNISTKTHVLEETQHLVVGRVVGQEETQIRVAQHGSDANQASSATGDDGHILPRVQAVLALAMHLVVQLGDGLSQGPDAGRGAVFSGGDGYVDRLGPLEAPRNIILDLGGALAQVGPGVGLLEEAILGGAFGAPDDAGRGAARVEAGVRQVALVGVSELAMDLGLDLWRKDEGLSATVVFTDRFREVRLHGVAPELQLLLRGRGRRARDARQRPRPPWAVGGAQLLPRPSWLSHRDSSPGTPAPPARPKTPASQPGQRLNSPFAEGSTPLKRRISGFGTPVWRFTENLRPPNMVNRSGFKRGRGLRGGGRRGSSMRHGSTNMSLG